MEDAGAASEDSAEEEVAGGDEELKEAEKAEL